MKKLLFLTAMLLLSSQSVFAQGNNGRSLQDYYASKYGSSSSSSSSTSPSSKPPAFSPPSDVATGQSQRAVSDEQRIIDAVAKRNFSYDTANTSQRVIAQPAPNGVPKFDGNSGAKSYSEMFKTDHRTLPGFDPATADKPVMPNLNQPPYTMPNQNASVSKPKHSSTIGEYVTNKLKGASSTDRSYYNQLMSEQHFSRPHQPGPQRVPQGGYIHVMKDGRARNYFQGK
ncbi:MAG: hypothetical protein K2X93_11910 [Candidatus Obscuribacterales bacterium]|nr:hypothetical protein [Candidatus Obscuribacterales bacterium]